MNTNLANSPHAAFRKRGQQRGAVLIVSLIMLVIITLLAVSAVQTSNLEMHMAVNTQARASALATAENALVDGELWVIANFPGVPLFDWSDDAGDADEDGRYTIGDIASSVDDVAWTVAPATGVDPVGYQLSANGNQYTLEYLGPYTTLGSSLTVGVPNSEKRYLYRVTGRGVFGSGGTRFVQSVFATTE